ncbi:MAG: MgtC/SapB family protein [Patescibacteria group bacterium]|nr:MgtC/SapB family protein [Patescibacteria group bacterium]
MELIGGNLDIFLRLVAAMVLGGALGLERWLAGKMAGVRTYALISVGSALFVIVSIVVSEQFVGITVFDPLRVASQIVVGIGFIGAGLIIFKESKVRGLTTAAGLWVAAGIGMATGFGLYSIAVFTTLLTLFIFTVLWFIEKRAIIKKKKPG